MIGKPKFTYGDYVKFYLDNKLVYGTVYIVDAFGIYGDHSDVYYDIFAYFGNEKVLVKHIKEIGVELDIRKKVFISQPMRGMSKFDIVATRNKFIENHLDIFEDVNILDTVFDEENRRTYNNEPLYYLAKSIECLSDADLVVFMPGWDSTRGCMSEHYVALQYEVPMIVCDDKGNIIGRDNVEK